MAEEQRCQLPDGHRLCANNCGFFGSSATMNLCSKCYRDFRLKEEQQVSTKSTIEAALSASPSSSSSSSLISPDLSAAAPPPLQTLNLPELSEDLKALTVSTGGLKAAKQSNRCSVCRKRVGLTGFRCKCGTTCCGTHRYPEEHGCTFDFKTVGREEIARANPLVKGDKLKRI